MRAAVHSIAPVVALVALVAAASACRFEADFDGSRYACATDDECPGSQTCFFGYCQVAVDPPDDPDAAPPDDEPDAAPLPDPADAAPNDPDAAEMLPEPDAGPCTLGQFHDDFQDAVTAPLWESYADSPTTTRELAGFFVITMADNVAGDRYAGYTSTIIAEGRQQHLELELVQVPTQVQGTNVYFKIEDPTNYRINAMFLVEVDELHMRIENVSLVDEKIVPYDAVAHRFMAFDTTNDKISFSTSTDGVTWNLQFTASSPFALAQTRVALGAGTWKAVPSPGNAVFARVGESAGASCP